MRIGDQNLPEVISHRVPKYYCVKERLTALIDGAAPGTHLPTERDLSEQFDTSRTTVRQALTELAAEGRVDRVQGRGTFVSPPKVTIPFELTSHTDAMRDRGITPGSRLVHATVTSARQDVAEQLLIAAGEPVVSIARVRLGDGSPMAVENVHLVASRFPEIVEHFPSADSLYELLATTYDTHLTGATQTVESAVATPLEAALLGTAVGAPLLMLTRTTWTRDGTRVEFTSSLYRGDRYRFIARMAPPVQNGDNCRCRGS